MDEADSSTTALDSTSPRVSPLGQTEGLYIADPIEGARFEIYTETSPTITDADPEQFYFPVDTAARVDATEFRVPVSGNPIIRDNDGQLITDCAPDQTVDLDSGEYHVELTGAPMKLYLATNSSLTLDQHSNRVEVTATSGPTILGVRSFHDKPAGRITIPPTPSALQDAVSHLGSALKTQSPERSFPTLRGHPPLIEVGDSFTKPDSIQSPDSDVTIVVPPELDYIFGISSLAYYLGADVVSGKEPRIIAAGTEFELSKSSFHNAVNERLRQLVFLDCLTRTEGYYQVELYEQTRTNDTLNLDYESLYSAPLADRTARYLETNLEEYREYIPEWDLTADIHPTVSRAPAIPFLANDLALIRTPSRTQTPNRENREKPESLDELLRNDSAGTQPSDGPDAFTPPESNSIEHVHIGPGYPLGSSKATIQSLQQRLERPDPPEEAIQVDVVCNDGQMREEDVVKSIYGERDFLDFDITVHYELSTDELAAVLATETDFLHYIGHVDENGIRCTDGYLSIDDVQTVNVEAFLLNACRSYDQGMKLIQRGGVGGIVTVGDVSNRPAIQVGRSLARLLNQGFPLRASLLVAKRESVTGYQYVVVGDGQLQVAQCVNGFPWVVDVRDQTASGFEVCITTFPVKGYGVGSLMAPTVDGGNERCLRPGTKRPFEVTQQQFRELVEDENRAIRWKNELYWSGEVVSEDSVEFGS